MKAIDAPPLVLEPQMAAHAREMFAVLSDPAIYEFENEPPRSEEALADRFTKLASRASPDGKQAWLNWVIRVPSGELAGYVQATVLQNGAAFVAYELGSKHWRQGIGSKAVAAVLAALRREYGVNLYVAVLKASNYRSLGLLRKLGFQPASAEDVARFRAEADEAVMVKPAGARSRTASCVCGQLRIEVQGEPRVVGVCHCLACQQRTGSVFATLAGFSAPYQVLGKATEYVRTGDQGAMFRFRFCPACGTNLFHTEEGVEGGVSVAVGGFADPTFPQPRYSVYDSRRRSWVTMPPGIIAFEKDPP